MEDADDGVGDGPAEQFLEVFAFLSLGPNRLGSAFRKNSL
jgi:hypothetical protein